MQELVSAIHGCALQPGRWHETLAEMLDYLGGSGGMLWSHQATPGAFGLWVPCHLHPESLAEYGRYYHQKDIWMQAGYAQNCQPGDVLTGEMLVPRPAFLKSEFYRDFLSRFDYAHLLFGILHRDDRPDSVVPTVHFSMYRGKSDRAFGERDRKKLLDLLPYLQHATAINFHLAIRDQRLEIAQASVDLFADVLFFADAAGRVVYANRAAEKLLAQNDGLCMKDQTLTAASAAENRALQQLFAAESAESAESAGLLRISRRSGKQPYLATRMQVSSETATPDARRPSVVVLVHDPEWNIHGRIAALCKRHALTAAECSVVEALLKTGSAKAAATHLRLSDNTIKTHLKSIFSKTGSHRQADLIRLALSFPRL